MPFALHEPDLTSLWIAYAFEWAARVGVRSPARWSSGGCFLAAAGTAAVAMAELALAGGLAYLSRLPVPPDGARSAGRAPARGHRHRRARHQRYPASALPRTLAARRAHSVWKTRGARARSSKISPRGRSQATARGPARAPVCPAQGARCPIPTRLVFMAEERQSRAGKTPTKAARRTAPVRGAEHAARAASRSLEGLIGHPTEGVSAVRRVDDGWCVVVDVLELPRIPDTTSLLASYEVQLDQDGELLEYCRVRRYRRGSADE